MKKSEIKGNEYEIRKRLKHLYQIHRRLLNTAPPQGEQALWDFEEGIKELDSEIAQLEIRRGKDES